MAPKLRVLISTSGAYPPTTECTVNSTTPTPFSTPSFDGDVSVWIKDFTGDNKGGDGHEYFDQRPGMTYGIVVRGESATGRDLISLSADIGGMGLGRF